MTRSKRSFVIIGTLVVLVLLDHLTKWAAIVYLNVESAPVYHFLGDMFRLQYAENKGAFLSLGAGLPDGARALVMTGLNTLILFALLIYLFAARKIAFTPLCALSLVAAGGIGNLIDRVFRDGRVVDFMNMGISYREFHLRTGIFNVADVAIMAGLFLIILNEMLLLRKGKEQKEHIPAGKEKQRKR